MCSKANKFQAGLCTKATRLFFIEISLLFQLLMLKKYVHTLISHLINL